MWLFLPQGFFSVSSPKHEPDLIQVRARKEEHIRALAEHIRFPIADSGLVIEDKPERDYQYRIYLPKDVFQKWMSEYVDKIDYYNFKPEAVKATGREYGDLLVKIWWDLFELFGDNWDEYNDSPKA